MTTLDPSQPGEPAPVLRDGHAADLPAIQAIYAHHVLHGVASFEEQAPDLAEMTRRWHAVTAQGRPYIVAARGDEVLGYAYASSYRSRPAYRFTVEDTIYIRHDRLGLGLGRLLLDELIARCTAQGLRQMIAVVGGMETVGSMALHEKLGFRRVGELHGVGYKFGNWVDSVLMQRALGDGNDEPPA